MTSDLCAISNKLNMDYNYPSLLSQEKLQQLNTESIERMCWALNHDG